ncbi:MAG: chain length determinant protein EpsF, partial [Clostridia bacterium]|nr:chain length determinant protein EpsF [Deltaproteobacteria bacterium]
MTLRQFYFILLARKWLMLTAFAVTVAVTAVVTLMQPSRYTATASVVVDFKAVDPVLGTFMPVVQLPGYLATQLDIISSRNVALKVVDKLHLADATAAQEAFQKSTGGNGSIRDWLAMGLLGSLKLEPSRESSMVNINFRGTDPKFAAEAANAFMEAYVNTNLELKVEPARQTTAFFNEQLLLLKESLTSAQKKLSAFQREKGITATDERFDVENARLGDLSTQVVSAQAQAYESTSRRQQVNETVAKGGSADTLSDVLNNPVIQSIKHSITLSEGKLNDASGKYGKNHPQYIAAAAEVEELKRKLADEMSTVQRSVNTSSTIASQREGSLRGALSAQRARVLEMKKQRDDSAFLARDVENAQRAYDTAMTRFTQTRLESQNNQTNISVINRAIAPLTPSSP